MIGELITLRPAIVEKIKTAGHELGVHTYTHPDFWHYKGSDYQEFLEKEVDKTEKAFTKVVGVRPYLFRMPYGYVKPWVKEIARQKKYYLINWTFGCDWTSISSDVMYQSYAKHIKPGAIFLLHDGGNHRQKTLEVVPRLIEEIEKRGYKIVPVGELLKLKPI
jgi:peptidoglycan/xylan/chitin deacetylase (PgdA/CDA1 family)